MSHRASPTLIGAFVAGAVVLSVVAVIMFSSGRYFHKTYRFVLFFSSSVNGLRVGALVKFRGVEVGSVEDIQLQLDTNTQVQHIPVIIEVDPDHSEHDHDDHTQRYAGDPEPRLVPGRAETGHGSPRVEEQ